MSDRAARAKRSGRGRAFGALVLHGSLILAALVSGCSSGSGARVRGLTAPTDSAASDPALAIDPTDGAVLLAWLSRDGEAWKLEFARSRDGGETWDPAVTVTPAGEPIHPHGESSPRMIAASGGRLAIVWSTSWKVTGREWPASNVRFSRSLDGGKSWSAPLTLNSDSAGAPGSHSFFGASLAGDSELVVAWLDERAPKMPLPSDSGSYDPAIYLARSPDFGGRWLGNDAAWGSVCPCCRVHVAANATGRVAAAWRHHAPGQIRDVVIADLDSMPASVNEDRWEFTGCPHSGPSIAIEPGGSRHVLWYTGAPGRAGVHYRRMPGDGSTLAPVSLLAGDSLPTAHVSLALSEQLGPVAAWDVSRDGRRSISIGRPASRLEIVPIPNSDEAIYPQLVALRDRPQAIVAWTKTRDAGNTLGLATVEWPAGR